MLLLCEMITFCKGKKLVKIQEKRQLSYLTKKSWRKEVF